MANEGFIRQLTNEHVSCRACGGSGRTVQGLTCEACGGSGSIGGAYRVASLRGTVFAGIVLTVAGVVLVWLFMFLLAHG